MLPKNSVEIKVDRCSAVFAAPCWTVERRASRQTNMSNLPLHGTGSPVPVERQYCFHFFISKLKVKHLQKHEQSSSWTKENSRRVKQVWSRMEPP